MSVVSWCYKNFCVVPCASFCTGHFVMVPLNMTCLHCLQHSLFVHLFNLYYKTFLLYIQIHIAQPTVNTGKYVITWWILKFNILENSVMLTYFLGTNSVVVLSPDCILKANLASLKAQEVNTNEFHGYRCGDTYQVCSFLHIHLGHDKTISCTYVSIQGSKCLCRNKEIVRSRPWWPRSSCRSWNMITRIDAGRTNYGYSMSIY